MRHGWLVVGACVLACGGSKDEPAAAPSSGSAPAPIADAGPPLQLRLITDAEIARYEADVMRRIDDNGKRTCPRPVLRGTPVAGSAAVALSAFETATGKLATCLTAVNKLAGENKLITRTPELVAHERECGADYEAVVRAAGSHEDACSPLQIGQREPKSLLVYMSAMRPLALRAHLLAERGEVDAALWLLIDALRFQQDLMRGHASLMVHMVATAGEGILLEQAAEILAARAPAKLDDLAIAVDRLIASEPGFAGALAAETEHLALYYGVAPSKPAGWTPPGGWPEGMGPGRPGDPNLAGAVSDPRDRVAIMLVSAESMRARAQKACPADAGLAACRKGLADATADAVPPSDSDAAIAELAKLARAGAYPPDPAAPPPAELERVRLRIRDGVAEILSGMTLKIMPGYVVKRAAAVAQLVGFRLHLEVHRTRHCPAVAELFKPPYAKLRAPAVLGDEVVVSNIAGALVVDPPAWADADNQKPPWRIPCK